MFFVSKFYRVGSIRFSSTLQIRDMNTRQLGFTGVFKIMHVHKTRHDKIWQHI